MNGDDKTPSRPIVINDCFDVITYIEDFTDGRWHELDFHHFHRGRALLPVIAQNILPRNIDTDSSPTSLTTPTPPSQSAAYHFGSITNPKLLSQCFE